VRRSNGRPTRRAPARHSPFYDLLDALGRPGCALCSLADRTRWRYLDSLAYENVNDIATREKLRVALGFCNRHAWFFVENVREVFGAGIIYRDLLHAVQHRSARADRARDPFTPNGPCIACRAEIETVDDAIETLVESLASPDLRDALLASDGLCVPHLRRAVATARGEAQANLLSLVTAAWERSSDEGPRLRIRAVGASAGFGVDDDAFANSMPGSASSGTTLVPLTNEPFACAVCRAVRASLNGFASWNDLDDGEGGVCNVHAWWSADASAPILYRRQIGVAREAVGAEVGLSGRSFVSQAIRNLGLSRPAVDPPRLPIRCVVCRHQVAVESRLGADYHGTLCVPHLRRALAFGMSDVLTAQRDTWQELDRLLGEYLRKEDYRFRAEPRGIEQASPRWAVALIAGEPGIR